MVTLPESFLKQIEHVIPDREKFLMSMNEHVPTSVRINPKKQVNVFENTETVAWCKTGFYLEQRPVFTLDPLLHAGGYYVQEASSMFLEQAIIQLGLHAVPLNVLDACAAPGGKSTHLASLLHPGSLLVCNETIKTRLAPLIENMVKWGNNNVVITNNDTKELGELTHFFDVIVCDAPCSGEGLFRKDDGALNHWSEENVKLCTARQKRIVHDLWNALKPGGFFIYSTCTYNNKENEDTVLDFLREADAECVSLSLDDTKGITEIKKEGAICYRFFPHKTKGEGFALSVLKKGSGIASKTTYRSSSRYIPLEKKTKEAVKHHVTYAEKKYFFRYNNDILFIPAFMEKELDLLASRLKVTHAGTLLGEMKGNTLVPSHELALSTEVNQGNFPCVAVDKQTALRILKGETQFNFDTDNGYCLMTYQQTPFAFMKKINNRFNNLYPKSWYIRMGI